MASQRTHQKALHLWLDIDLVGKVKAYQHAHQLDSLTQAVDQLLREGLAQEDASRIPGSDNDGRRHEAP